MYDQQQNNLQNSKDSLQNQQIINKFNCLYENSSQITTINEPFTQLKQNSSSSIEIKDLFSSLEKQQLTEFNQFDNQSNLNKNIFINDNKKFNLMQNIEYNLNELNINRSKFKLNDLNSEINNNLLNYKQIEEFKNEDQDEYGEINNIFKTRCL